MDETNRHYLFVCAANRNRGPTAEGVFRALAAHGGLDVQVSSAGWSPFSERPVTKELADSSAETIDQIRTAKRKG